MKILVCGGRNYHNWEWIRTFLDRYENVTHCITGGALGTDEHALFWAWEKGIQTVRCEANWNAHGKRAGHLRNSAMAALQPDIVIAFPGGRGTAHMVETAKRLGIRCDIAPPQPDSVVREEDRN